MKKTIYTAAIAATLMMAGCSEDGYKLYDINQVDHVSFAYKNSKQVADSVVSYNFGYDIADYHMVNIPIDLMGMPADHARGIAIEAVADSSDMVEGTHYTIERAELRANGITDTVKIKLLRNNDPAIQEREFKLLLRINANNDLAPTGQTTFTIKYSDIRPSSRPDWWSTYSALPVYSFENAQLFFKYFYELAPKANKEVYDEMIGAYGEYFVNAVSLQGPMAMYDAFLNQYVLIPMYRDHKDDVQWQSVPHVN